MKYDGGNEVGVYRTTAKQREKLYQIADSMRLRGIEESFIRDAVKLAEYYEGAFDLFELWFSEEDAIERNQIVTDLKNEIKEDQDRRSRALAELHKIDQQLKPETRELISGIETEEDFEDIDLD